MRAVRGPSALSGSSCAESVREKERTGRGALILGQFSNELAISSELERASSKEEHSKNWERTWFRLVLIGAAGARLLLLLSLSGTSERLSSNFPLLFSEAALSARREFEKERRLSELALTEPEKGSVENDVDEAESVRPYVGLDGGDERDAVWLGEDDEGSAVRYCGGDDIPKSSRPRWCATSNG